MKNDATDVRSKKYCYCRYLDKINFYKFIHQLKRINFDLYKLEKQEQLQNMNLEIY